MDEYTKELEDMLRACLEDLDIVHRMCWDKGLSGLRDIVKERETAIKELLTRNDEPE
jgi:hypothetical protein